MRKKLEENDKKLKMDKNIVALENFRRNQLSPLDISGLGFQKGESSSHVCKNNNEEPKRLLENNNNKKGSSNQGNKQ